MDEATFTRSVAFDLERAAADDDGLTLEGYAAVFNSPTRIVDWRGEYDEVIAPGAFRRTINAGTPILMFDHGQHPVLGSMPIGGIRDLREDKRGLFVRARLFDNWMTAPLADAIRDGAVDGMSFRFTVVKEESDTTGKVELRTIREVKLHELGPVVFPAYKDTSVALRSLSRVLPDLVTALGTPEGLVRSAQDTPDGPAGTDDPPARALVAPDWSSRRLEAKRLVARTLGGK